MHEDRKIKQMMQSYLGEVVHDPSVQSEKNRFIESHFKEKRPSLLTFPRLIPVLSLAMAGLLAVFLFLLQRPEQLGKIPQPGITEEIPASGPVTAEISETVFRPGSQAAILEIKSDLGSPMVYQKMDQDVPITIVWVFFNGRVL